MAAEGGTGDEVNTMYSTRIAGRSRHAQEYETMAEADTAARRMHKATGETVYVVKIVTVSLHKRM